MFRKGSKLAAEAGPEDETPEQGDPPDDGEEEGEEEEGDKAKALLSCFGFDRLGKTWRAKFHAATDHPRHPLRHLKGV